MRKGTIEYLNEGLVFFKELRTKYNNKFSLTEITSQLTAITTSEQGNHNRQFIDSHREEKGTDMDWDEYFEAVKKKCLFKRYTKYHSVESANSGAKKKRSKSKQPFLIVFNSFYFNILLNRYTSDSSP